jgi:hypothetical protein
MKRNETVLVYAVTGLLLGILVVAIVFGDQPVAKLATNPEKTAELPGVTPALMGVEDGDAAEKASQPSLEDAAGGITDVDPAGVIAAGEPPAVDGETPAGEDPPTAKEPDSVALSNPVVVQDARLEEAYGTSRREGDYRVVKGWRGSSLVSIVERWTGSREALGEAKTLNESLGAEIAQGEEILVPWVDAQHLLAAKDVRDASRAKIDWSKGELYVLKKGDSLWKVASNRVANNMIPAWLEKFKGLNPQVTDLGALIEGQKVHLPRSR